MFAVTQQEAQDSPRVVTSTLELFGLKVKVLFDSGPTHSFVSLKFSQHIPITREILAMPLQILTPVGKSFRIDGVFRNCHLSMKMNVWR